MANMITNNIEEKRLKCLIVDDEPIAIDGLMHYVAKLDFLEIVQTCFSAIEAEKILKTTKVDRCTQRIICYLCQKG